MGQEAYFSLRLFVYLCGPGGLVQSSIVCIRRSFGDYVLMESSRIWIKTDTTFPNGY